MGGVAFNNERGAMTNSNHQMKMIAKLSWHLIHHYPYVAMNYLKISDIELGDLYKDLSLALDKPKQEIQW